MSDAYFGCHLIKLLELKENTGVYNINFQPGTGVYKLSTFTFMKFVIRAGAFDEATFVHVKILEQRPRY